MINGFYLDESGNTGFGDIQQQPVVCYGGVLVPNNKLFQLEQDFKAISDTIKGLIKGQIRGLKARDIDELKFFREYELHSKKFFDGDDLFSKIPWSDRLVYAQKILTLLRTHDCRVLSSVINKSAYLAATQDKNHINMHQLCISQVVHVLDEELSNKNESGVIIPDQGREDEFELLVRTVRQQTQSGRIFCNLFPQESHKHLLVQIADLVVFLTTVFYRTKYGHVRKSHNALLSALYQSHIEPIAVVAEY